MAGQSAPIPSLSGTDTAAQSALGRLCEGLRYRIADGAADRAVSSGVPEIFSDHFTAGRPDMPLLAPDT